LCYVSGLGYVEKVAVGASVVYPWPFVYAYLPSKAGEKSEE